MRNAFLAFMAIMLILPVSVNANTTANEGSFIDTNPAHYHASWDSQSEYPVLEPLEITTVWINFLNEGNATWYNSGDHPVRLGTSNSLDRISAFYKHTWITENRPATLTESEVKPGDIGTFKFYIKAPEKPGHYQEYFRPVVEGLTWMEDNGVFIDITVSGDPNNYTEDAVKNQTYECAWNSQSEYLTLAPTESQTVWVKFKNTGTAVWHNYGDNPLRLGTDRAQDRSSNFVKDTWLASNRPANLKESTVQPGEYGTFEFNIKAPSTAGTYIEYFRPVAEGITWLNDNGVYWKFSVTGDNSNNNSSDFNLTAQLSNGQVVLNWTNYNTLQTSSSDNSISGYKVVRSETKSNPTYPEDWWVYLSDSNTTTYTDSSAQSGKSYYYRVGAYKSDTGVVEYTNNVFVTISGTDNENTDEEFTLSASNQSNGVKLNWEKYTNTVQTSTGNIEGYKILRSTTDSTPTYPDNYLLYISGIDNNTYLDTDAVNGQKYYYRIGAYKNGSVVAYSNIIDITASNNNFETVEDIDLDVTNQSGNLKLTWSKYTANDIDGYKIMRSTSNSSPKFPNEYYKYVSGQSSLSYIDTDTSSNKGYYYRIGAYQNGNIFAYSNTVYIVSDNNNDSDSEDIELSVQNTSNGLKLSWDEYNDSDIDGYKVLRSTSDSTPTYPPYYKYITGYASTSYTDTAVDDGETYYYRIGVYQNGEVIAYSNTVDITYDENNNNSASEEIQLTIKNTTSGIKLSWDEYSDSDIDGYKVLRSTSDSTPTYPPYYKYITGYDSTGYVDTDVEDGQKYYYRIGVYQDGEVIAYSNTEYIYADK